MDRHFWSEALIVEDYFWEQVEKNRTEADIPFKLTSSSSRETIPHDHQTPFMDHKEGQGIWIHPRLVMRLRAERVEICWSVVDFEAKSQTNPAFASWTTELMADSAYSDAIVSASNGKDLNLLKTPIINKSPLDLEFLISRWSVESHTFVAAWGEFGPTLEDVIVPTGLAILTNQGLLLLLGSQPSD